MCNVIVEMILSLSASLPSPYVGEERYQSKSINRLELRLNVAQWSVIDVTLFKTVYRHEQCMLMV